MRSSLIKLLVIAAITRKSSQYNTRRANPEVALDERGNTVVGNTECFIRDQIIQNTEMMQRGARSQQECMTLCQQHSECRAAMLDKHYGRCHIFRSGYTKRDDYSRQNRFYSAERSCFDNSLSQDTSNAFGLVDSSGNKINGQQKGLLLYNGLTVCGEHFNKTAAHAICRLMGFKSAISAENGKTWKIQEMFKVFPQSLSCWYVDWSACTFKNRENDCNDHSQDVFLTCSGKRSPFVLVNQFGSQISGQQEFLLLYNGGTVCGDQFSDNSAHAVCRDMGYYAAKSWRMDQSYWLSGSSQSEYHISLDDVYCTEADWKSCSYTTSHDCDHGKVIYLSCSQILNDQHQPNSTSDSGGTSVVVALLCIALVVAVVMTRKNSEIETLKKEKMDTEAVVRHLQEELRRTTQEIASYSEKTGHFSDASENEYQNVASPD
ncbi:hypothetical protein ACHWQZ_G005756 [Mnemiopsis leidyi]